MSQGPSGPSSQGASAGAAPSPAHPLAGAAAAGARGGGAGGELLTQGSGELMDADLLPHDATGGCRACVTWRAGGLWRALGRGREQERKPAAVIGGMQQ
jgi:hypothetical protein